MRGVGDAIDHGDRAIALGLLDDLVDRVDLAHDVGRVREAHGADLAVEQLVERGGIEMAGDRVDLPLADDDAAIGQPAPGAAIGLVILVGDDHCVARLQPAGEGVAEGIGVAGGGRAEMDPVHADIERLRHPAMRQVHGRAGLTRSRIEAVGLHLVGAIVMLEPTEHLLAGIGAAGILEEGPAIEARLAERRKLGADQVGVEGQGGHGALARREDRWLAERCDRGNAACG